MTRPNALVLDGSEVKLRLEAERTASQTNVHVDWLRATFLRRNAPLPSADVLFGPEPFNVWEASAHRLHKCLLELPDCDHFVGAEAAELAQTVAEALGDDFSVAAEVRKGHDFYRFRWSIERNSAEVGWVGFMASSDSPRQRAQANTIHVNLYGAACTFASHGWRDRMASVIEAGNGTITRCDLALDFFDGLPGGMDRVTDDYKSGAMNVSGKRPTCNMVGDWMNGAERSFYIGSKGAGKQTNVYEKGQQLFGRESGSQWMRVELRYGNKLRELSTELLRRPADFFAGASDWHASMLALADEWVMPEPVKCTSRIAAESVQAEVTRVLRWLRDTAAPTVAFAVQHVDQESLWDLIGTTKLPGRLKRFLPAEAARACGESMQRFFKGAAAGHGTHSPQPMAVGV